MLEINLNSKIKRNSDLSNKKFGKLLVLNVVENFTKISKSQRKWNCQCECGNKKEVSSGNLVSGHTKSCGCLVSAKTSEFFRLKDLKGKKFNKLLVLGSTTKDINGVLYQDCLCDCGNLAKVVTVRLTNGSTKSCGCLLQETGILKRKNYGEACKNRLLREYKYSAKSRKIDFYITDEDCTKLFKGNCHYCGIIPSQIKQRVNNFGEYYYNGIDRINSKEGYIYGNCVSCCKTCNQVKLCLTEEEFYNWLLQLHNKYNLSIKEVSSSFVLSNVSVLISTYKKTALKRKLIYLLSDCEAKKLFSGKCFYCGVNPSQKYFIKKKLIGPYNGIDRIDNTKGYFLENCVSCCKICNFAKSNKSAEEFLIWADKAYEYTKNRRNEEVMVTIGVDKNDHGLIIATAIDENIPFPIVHGKLEFKLIDGKYMPVMVFCPIINDEENEETQRIIADKLKLMIVDSLQLPLRFQMGPNEEVCALVVKESRKFMIPIPNQPKSDSELIVPDKNLKL